MNSSSNDFIRIDNSDSMDYSLDEYIRLHNIDKDVKNNPHAKHYGRKITEDDLYEDLKVKGTDTKTETETHSFQKGSFVYKFAPETGNSGFSLNIERNDPNQTNQTKDVKSLIKATLTEMSRKMLKQSKVNSNSLFRISKPNVTKATASGNGNVATQDLVRMMKQETAAKYNMLLQKRIATIQNKPLITICTGTQAPIVDNVDGFGIDDIQVTPNQTTLSLNTRFR